MPARPSEAESDDAEDFFIFPLTELHGNALTGNDDEITDDLDPFDHAPTQLPRRGSHFIPAMTLKSRRRSLLGTGGGGGLLGESKTVPNLRRIETDWRGKDGCKKTPEVPFKDLPPKERWKRALVMLQRLKDPWERFRLDALPSETALRHRYNALKGCWVVDEVTVKMEAEPFNHGAMRSCYRLKKLTMGRGGKTDYTPDWKQQGRNYVAKVYMEEVERDVYLEDVRLQMDAKLWGEEYNRHAPPKKVDVLQMSVLEFTHRADSPLFHLEHFIDGDYVKYNSNSGFVEESLRLTPQAFSHFTFERSGHTLIVVDVQGVGDLWTDPQIHTADGRGYGDGNLGARGMALFFHSHVCNSICTALALSRFDLAPSEMIGQTDFIRRAQKDSVTRVRGSEEVCLSASPRDIGAHFAPMFSGAAARRYNRTFSENSSAPSDDSCFDDPPMRARLYVEEEDVEEEDMSMSFSPMSPLSPIDRPRKFLVDSDDSISASASVTEEEESRKFRNMARSGSRPSCVALQADSLRGLRHAPIGESVLGQIHHELAAYHELGRFLACRDDPYDVDAALFHERQAATLGVKSAIVTLASIYLGLQHDTLASVSVEATSDNVDAGVDYMLTAADAGDRGAMLYVAKAFESGNGLGSNRERSYSDAVEWYEKAAHMTAEDESGEFDATMDDPLYQLKAAMAGLYLSGGFGLEKDASYAGDLYTEAAECATAAMKGRLASKYFALAEEAYAQVEE